MRARDLLGPWGEAAAAAYLRKKGFRIEAMNYRTRLGEIDIIARDGRYLVFVEVKYRSTMTSGWASQAVDYHKQQRICKAAQFYLICHGYGEVPCRFDVVAVDGEKLQWIRNAFEYCT